jgi:hypothetical protein
MTNNRRQHPDYDIPADFDLSRHATSRQAWELGDGDLVEVLVIFSGASGAVSQGAALGEPVVEAHAADSDDPDLARRARRFRVRRPDAFLRWVLSFAGDARPVAPSSMVEGWRQLLADTRAAHVAGQAAASPLTTEPRS